MEENWLERTERMLRKMHCTPEENLECAMSLLQDEAYQWWVSVTRAAPPERIHPVEQECSRDASD